MTRNIGVEIWIGTERQAYFVFPKKTPLWPFRLIHRFSLNKIPSKLTSDPARARFLNQLSDCIGIDRRTCIQGNGFAVVIDEGVDAEVVIRNLMRVVKDIVGNDVEFIRGSMAVTQK